MNFFKKKKSVFVRMSDMYANGAPRKMESGDAPQPPPDELSRALVETAPGEHPTIPTGMWKKCPYCHQAIYSDDLDANRGVCPECGHNFRLSARERVAYTVDAGSFREINENLKGSNPLDFPGYAEKLEKARQDTGNGDAVVTGFARIEGHPLMLCVMDSNFMMGSMGACVGEKMVRAFEAAGEKRLPLVAFTCSGGARMQEGIVSLMQMAKVSGAAGRFAGLKLPYIVVLTDPTTGGVTASFAMLGDITLAEPGALIGFAGQRVIQQTTGQNLPSGFQRAEFLLQKGFVDAIIPRAEMRPTLANLLALHGEAM